MGISPEAIRLRALQAFEQGAGTKRAIAQNYGISERTFRRWWREYTMQNKTGPAPRGHNPAALSAGDLARLDRLLARKPAMTLEQLRAALEKTCSLVTIHNAAKRLNWRYAKNGACGRIKAG